MSVKSRRKNPFFLSPGKVLLADAEISPCSHIQDTSDKAGEETRGESHLFLSAQWVALITVTRIHNGPPARGRILGLILKHQGQRASTMLTFTLEPTAKKVG